MKRFSECVWEKGDDGKQCSEDREGMNRKRGFMCAKVCVRRRKARSRDHRNETEIGTRGMAGRLHTSTKDTKAGHRWGEAGCRGIRQRPRHYRKLKLTSRPLLLRFIYRSFIPTPIGKSLSLVLVSFEEGHCVSGLREKRLSS